MNGEVPFLLKRRVAIVHEWFVSRAGSEKVVEQILKVYPEADLFALVDFLDPSMRGFIQGKPVRTTFIQNLPGARKHFRSYLPLMPLAVEQLDLSRYDVVISSNHAVAKGVITGPDQLHISYVHTPIRYAWDLQHQYLSESGLSRGLKSAIARLILHYMRQWDVRSANGVDVFIANSEFISRRIQKVYRRDCEVIYPPVDVEGFPLHSEKEGYFLTASRMVPYKKVPLIVQAFAQMPDKRLVVIGEGSDFERVKALATPNVTVLGFQSNELLVHHMQRASAFVFAAEEDFGITPVEAQACGTPVIAFGKGGSLETVLATKHGSPGTGLFFAEQSVDSIVDAVKRFDLQALDRPFAAGACREHAERFAPSVFREGFRACVERSWESFAARPRG